MPTPCHDKGMWVIGYGLLIFKPPPLYEFRVVGTIHGFVRRFWQSSIDHRGTPQSPGRVATLLSLEDLRQPLFKDHIKTYVDTGLLVEQDRAVHDLSFHDLQVWGVAYYIAPANVEEVTRYLDVREQNGYSVHRVEFHVHSVPDAAQAKMEELSAGGCIESLIYIGTTDNEAFVGPESVEDTAAVIATAEGPSGKNLEYLLKLMHAVRELDPALDARDLYLERLAELARHR